MLLCQAARFAEPPPWGAEESRGRRQDLVRPPQLAVLPLELARPLALGRVVAADLWDRFLHTRL